MFLESTSKAIEIAKLALDKKGQDVVVLELRELVTFTDYFVICSAESTAQVKTIVEHIEEVLSKRDIKPLGVEGLSYSHWVLMDYGDVVVHVFEEQTRRYYELEKLWLDAPRIPLDENSDNLGGKNKRAVYS